MNHLDEITLNEYLDGMLDDAARQRVERHVAGCEECAAALAELRVVFMALDVVTEAPLTADLSTRLLQTIHPEPVSPDWGHWLLLGQAVGVMVMTGVLWSLVETVTGWIGKLVEAAVATGSTQLAATWEEWVVWGTAVWQQPLSPPPIFDLATGQWALLFALALITWLVGNRLLIPNYGGEHG